ncbi:FkbM family methyltransferase [Methylocaldum sp. 14B]|uniref:FkbM family methyltransferase n=1 Tax=Methylocaldum sp. 14B TaxID=1912213 RepID=UPI00098A7246|nr:FkbM family methyltransferase [Methylocaldum sp. 14B]
MNMDLAISPIPPFVKAAKAMTRLIPPVWRFSGISNRIVKPLVCSFISGALFRSTIWNYRGRDIEMILDPSDCVGGNLFFIPHMYDRWERKFLMKRLPKGGVFVDVGSNIGAYALFAAEIVGASGKVIAFEAATENFRLLRKNIEINGRNSVIAAYQIGISDKKEMLRLGLNRQGNRGANSFLKAEGETEEVQCHSLYDALQMADIKKIDVLKLDIEGFEYPVLNRFFDDIADIPQLKPAYILVEIEGGPQTAERKRQLRSLISDNGYRILRERENTLFERSA